MADLKDTYVVHQAGCHCSMGLRDSCAVLVNTHGVYLRQQAQMTVADCKMENVVNFGGCYSMANPSTQAAAAAIQAQVLKACPDTFLDKAIQFFCGDKKEIKQGDPTANLPMPVGLCQPMLMGGQNWSEGKDDVKTDGARALMGEAKLYCKFAGEIQITNSGQPES
jgi:hypothetical protein